MQIKTIISHESPDLDSILSIYLLRRYGSRKYPGIDLARLKFCPAGVLPGNKSPEDLENEGILAVDTGGGRLDTHPVKNKSDDSNIDKCASRLVAEDLGVERLPELEQILIFSLLQDIEGRSLQSRDAGDHAFSLPNIIAGFNLTADIYERTVQNVGRLLDAIIAAEKERSDSPSPDMARAINRYERTRVVVSRSRNGAAIKVLRWCDKAEQVQDDFVDMDIVLSAYLLRQYGRFRYPELANAVLELHLLVGEPEDVIDKSAGEKILVVDTGYTKLHSTGTENDFPAEIDGTGSSELRKSVAALIAEELLLDDVPQLAKLTAFSRQIDLKEQIFEAAGPIDRAVGIFNILFGLNLLNGRNFEKTLCDMEQILDVIVAREKDWCNAVTQYEANAKVYKTGKKGNIKIVAIQSESGTAIKVSRWRDKADLTIYQHLNEGHVSIVVRRYGPLHNFNLARLTKTIRVAEAIECGERIDLSELVSLGTVHGWFLHSSGKILSKGSLKATNVAVTQIPFEVLIDLVLSYFDRELKLPDKYCPVDRCIGRRCAFFHIKLSNCYVQREKLTFRDSSVGKRLDKDALEKLRKLKNSREDR